MSSDEMKDLESISAQELADLDELDGQNPSGLRKIGNHLKKHWGEMAGGTIGGAAGALATGGVGGEIPGAAFGAMMGEKIQRYVQGDPQPTLGDSVETGLLNAAGVATVGQLAGIAGGAASGFVKTGEKAVAESVLGNEAAQVAKGRLEDAQNLKVDPVLSYQSGDGTVMGARAQAEGQRVMSGDRGPIPQAQLVQAQQQQETAIQGYLNRLKDLFAPQKGRVPLEGEKLGHVTQELQPHEFAQNWLDKYHGMIDMVKTRAKEAFGDRQFDVSSLVTDIEQALKQNLIIDDNGQMASRAGKATPEELQLYSIWKTLKGMTRRQSGFSAQGGQAPGMQDVFPGAGQPPGLSHIQDPLSHGETPPLFGPTGRAGSVMGPPSGMPEINMTQLKPGQPGAQLGAQQVTDVGYQPNLIGQTPKSVPAKISMLPPNQAGSASAGITFQQLDNVVSKIQNISAASRDSMTSNPYQGAWDDLSKAATTKFHDVIRENLAPVDPEAANLLSRVDAVYSKYSDTVRDMAGQIKQNPSAAVKVFVNKANPDMTRQAFHFLTQEQGDMVRRQVMVDAFEKAMMDPNTKGASAKAMAAELRDYGPENLSTIFGTQKGDVLNALDAMAHLQNTQLKPSAQAANLRRIEDAASKSGILRQGLDIFNALLNKNKDLQKYIGSPEFQGRVLRKSQLYQSTTRKAVTQVGRDAAGSEIGVQGKELLNGDQ